MTRQRMTTMERDYWLRHGREISIGNLKIRLHSKSRNLRDQHQADSRALNCSI
jgi:hypothetical protein